jgi:serine/threonine protein kinase
MANSVLKGRTLSATGSHSFKPVRFGRYLLMDRVSRGGMSDIFLAKTGGFGSFEKPLIIKKLLPDYCTESRYVKRFVNEARTLASFNHSNIVQILDMGMVEGEYYIALEYIEGRNAAHILSKGVRTGRPPSPEFALHICMEVAKGLGYAHRKKGPSGAKLLLVHQDINSFNVMVSYEAEVKIIDFGIARMFLDGDSEHFPVAGKLLYFSPEQLQHKPVDRRVDIYGTGVLLYELLTGQRLVEHQETVVKTIKKILDLDIPQKVRTNDLIRPELKPILIKAMAFDPADRYAWMEEFTEELRQVVKRCSLDVDATAFSRYMKQLFQREMILDARRMRKLLTEPLPASLQFAGHYTSAPTEKIARKELSASGSSPAVPAEDEPASHELTRELRTRTVSIPTGKTIYRKGDRANQIYLLNKGKVKLWLQVGRNKRTIALLKPGDFFGEMALLEGHHHQEFARAEENSELTLVDRQSVEQLVSHETLRKLVRSGLTKLKDVESLVESELIEDSLGRLIYGLLLFHRRSAEVNGKDIDISELAEMLSLEDKEELKKYLDKLHALDVVHVDRNSVQVDDSKKLENILKVLSHRGELILKL